MNKILSGVLGVVVVAGMVGGSAFALLTDSASLTNLALSVGSADLQIKLTEDSDFVNERDVAGTFFGELVPGESNDVPFDLLNNASDVSLNLTGQIPTPGAGNWDELKSEVECVVFTAVDNNPEGDATVSSGWFSLDEWNTASRDLPGDPLDSDEEVSLMLRCMLLDTAGNDVSGMSLSGVEFEVTGTQIEETEE